jgi:hypothetical protein
MEYKPLKELANDEDACRQIFDLVTGEDAYFGCIKKVDEHPFFVIWEYKPSYYDDSEPLHHVFIHEDGSIYWMKGEMMLNDFSMFKLVDLIRSLGYSA